MPTERTICPHCGSEIKVVTKTHVTDEVDISDIFEDDKFCEHLLPHGEEFFYEKMSEKGVHIYTPNQIDAPGELFDPRGEQGAREYHPEGIQREVDAIEEMPQLDYLRELYGANAVSVKWGVLNWSS